MVLWLKKIILIYFDKYCILPNNLAIGYAIAVSLSGRCNKIYLAGFDGFKSNSSKNVK